MANEQKMIPQEVVDVMLDEIKSSMQATIDMLTQRNVTYRGTMKQLEMHGTALEEQVAELRAHNVALLSTGAVDASAIRVDQIKAETVPTSEQTDLP